MSAPTNAPLTTMVVALDVVAVGDAAHSRGQDDFARLLVSALGQRCAIQRFDRPGESSALSVVLLPNGMAAAVMQRTIQTAAQFALQTPDMVPRAVFHRGVVFSAEEDGRSIFVGSAIRSAQSLLRRLPKVGQYVGTKDFADMALRFGPCEVKIAKVERPNAVDELWELTWTGDPASAEPTAAPLHAAVDIDNAELQRYLRSRLAEDIGPFASAIVDSAVAAVPSLTGLIDELAREIDDASARTRFKKDAELQIASMDKRSLRYQQNKGA